MAPGRPAHKDGDWWAADPDPGRARPGRGVGGDRPGPFRGVLPLPISAPKSSSPVLRNPANRERAVPLTYEQFRYGFANAVGEDEAKQLYDTYAVPTRGKPLFQAATANLNPWTEAKVDTKNPDRGPLLLISGERDHTVPWAIANASYRQQQDNQGVTEIVKIKGRGHALTIDSGWREVADTALAFVQRFTWCSGVIPTGCRYPFRPPPRAGMPGAAPPLGSGTGFAGQRRS
jgi:non-heme chloroperoxidase